MTMAEQSPSLSRKIFIYKIIILFLAIGILFISYQYWQLKKHSMLGKEGLSGEKIDTTGIPYYKEIMDIIRPLDYSVIPSLKLQPDITLSIDFSNKTWTLHKLHQYNSKGNVIIEYNRYGLCGELASYTYTHIRPVLPDRYTIKFARVAQSGFFLPPGGTHVILIIYDKLLSKGYLLDPSLHRYGPIDGYQDYLFDSFGEKIEGVNNKEEDVTFRVNHGMPVTIYNNFISMFSVEDCNGKFDKDNFILSIQSNHRYDYTGRYLFSIQKKEGRITFSEDQQSEKSSLSPEDSKTIKKTLTTWFYSIGK